MKKITLLTPLASREETLEQLRQLGVLHLEWGARPAGESINELRQKIHQLDQALSVLSEIDIERGPESQPFTESAPEMEAPGAANRILFLHQELAELKEDKNELSPQQRVLETLGSFDPNTIGWLRDKGVFVRLYELTSKEWDRLTPAIREEFHWIGTRDERIYLAHISDDADYQAPSSLVELNLPEFSLVQLNQELTRLNEKIWDGQHQLYQWIPYRAQLSHELLQYQNAWCLEQAKTGMKDTDEVCYLQGYCPVRRLSSLQSTALDHGWALLTQDPTPEDPVPTLLRQSRWLALFQPVMKFIGVTPGYWEYDPNGLFLVFFTLFFAMIIGDAGYGLLLLGAAYAASRWWKAVPGRVWTLFYLLSAATLLWGAMTGVWFGSPHPAQWPVLNLLVIPELNAFDETSSSWVIQLCLGFGALHLCSAHLWAGVRYRSWQSLGELGWISIIAGLYGIASNLLLGGEHWAWMIWSVSIGLLLVLVFAGQRDDGFALGLGRGFRQLPVDLLTGIGSFSDVISYIRLFAVGLATKEVAAAFNDMAVQVGWNNVGAAMGFALILLLGHTVNLLLAAMGVLVHGLRLNLLEFSRHLNLNWSGIPYQPFRRLKHPVKSGELLQ